MSRKFVVSLVVLTFLGTALWTIGQSVVWQETTSIQNGQVIKADIIRNNFEWLKNKANQYDTRITSLTPPECVGENKALQWDGNTWNCHTDTPQGAGCIIGGLSLAHNQSLPFYKASYVPSSRTCQIQVRTCNNGQLSGDASYRYSSCKRSNWYQANGAYCPDFCSARGLRNTRDPRYGGAKCVSGEINFAGFGGRENIRYTYGTWGGGGAGGRTESQGGACYGPGQKRDHDATDFTVGCHCT